MRQLLALVTSAIIPLALLAPATSAESLASVRPHPKLQVASGGGDGSLGSAASLALSQGYLVPDQAAYQDAKAAAARRFTTTAAKASGLGTAAPVTSLSWKGVSQAGHSPSDSTGAIGTTRYVETVNSKVGIYDRTGALVASDSLSNFWNENGNNNFDPQITWTPRPSVSTTPVTVLRAQRTIGLPMGSVSPHRLATRQPTGVITKLATAATSRTIPSSATQRTSQSSV